MARLEVAVEQNMYVIHLSWKGKKMTPTLKCPKETAFKTVNTYKQSKSFFFDHQ